MYHRKPHRFTHSRHRNPTYRKRKISRHFVTRAKVKTQKLYKLKLITKVIIIFAILLAGLVFTGREIHKFVFLSGKFDIKQIDVDGIQSITKDEFIASLPVKLGDNLIATYFGGFSNRIRNSIPEIKSLKINRVFPDKIKFNVTERKPIASIEIEGKLNAVDDENVVFVTKKNLLDLPQILVETNQFTTADTVKISTDTGVSNIDKTPEESVYFWREISNAVDLLKQMRKKKTKLYLYVSKLYITDGKFLLLLKDNTKIIWGGTSSEVANIKLDYLDKTLIYAKERFANIEYIDLKLFNEGRVIVKP